ncbi:Serine/threonine protein kinase-like protein [Kitasatospora sp. MMS16-BH015]|uniref:serine/threonine-protein kinase n=1 Tax=Kitasatospora sp. MMS16-BH015 TaxID=2018025 RepID=UPI000CA26604|nr:serine/threonine-protein kinase [Kitasatospora sp. MMS16-BH015]AUG79381.1 Serine/threonine protein kinase-like protein [Kitasatospora sp. MMS16-BH015]
MAEQGQPGRLVAGRYRLVAELGAGGFGRVWRALDETLRVEVAVKEVWLPPAGSPADHADRLARAQREGRNAAALRDHPGIVAVHDVVVEGEAPWIVMQLVDGVSLQRQLDEQGAFPVERVAAVARALLSALGAAHAAGITHRDVKPANVLAAVDGRLLLTDFGIAVQAADTRLTTTGGLIGSLEYLAPERLDGVDDPAGDLYSLGVMLYQLVEGSSPFRRDTPSGTLGAVVRGEAPTPTRAGALEPLITALMRREPESRPTVAEALAMLPDPSAPTHPPTVLDRPAPVSDRSVSAFGRLALDRPEPVRDQAIPVVPLLPSVPERTPMSAAAKGWLAAFALAMAGLVVYLIVNSQQDHSQDDGGQTYSPPPAAASTPAASTPAASTPTPADDPSTGGATPSSGPALGSILPDSFTSEQGAVYKQIAGSVHTECSVGSMSDDVKKLLQSDGCSGQETGNYLATPSGGGGQVLISVQVFKLTDSAAAKSFYDGVWPAHRPDGTGEFGYWCPSTGPAEAPCSDGWDKNGLDERLALRQRYVVHSSAGYLDSGTARDKWTEDAALSVAKKTALG